MTRAFSPCSRGSVIVGAAEVREGLRKLEQDAPFVAPHGDAGALSGSRRGPAYGRVTALSSGEQYEFMLPGPTETLVQIARTATMIPIARAFDAARPVGLVDVHLDQALVIEAGAEFRELAHVALEPRQQADWVELKGPAAPNPLRGSRSSPQRERFAHRVDANRRRTLRGLSETLGRVARRRGWRSIVLAGDPALTRVIEPNVTSILRVDRPFPEWRPSADLAEHLRPVLAHARELAVATIAEAARLRPHGFARGLAATTEALRNGRARCIVAEGPLTDPRAAEIVRLAVGSRLPVLFANDQLMDHGIVCELHG